MSLQQAVEHLLESGRKAALPARASTGRALREVLAAPELHDGLFVSAPWQLSAEAALALEDRLDYAPTCGWRHLIGLAAGTGLIRAEYDLFLRNEDYEEILDARNDMELQQLLYNAFSSKLVPPQAAAALYVTLGVHPIWGLHLARARGVSMAPIGVANVDGIETAAKFVFGTIAGFSTALRQCDPEMRYPTDSLVEVLMEAGDVARKMARVDGHVGGLPLTVEGPTGTDARLTATLAVQDFFDVWLEPSGAVRRNGAGWFSTTPSVLAGGLAGDFNVEEQMEWYAAALDIEQGER